MLIPHHTASISSSANTHRRLVAKWTAVRNLPDALREMALKEDTTKMPLTIIPPMDSPPFGDPLEEEQ